MSIQPCPICSRSAEIESHGDSQDIVCERCGSFCISGTAVSLAGKSYTPRQRATASSLIRERWQSSLIDSNEIGSLFSSPDIPFSEKADRLLLHIGKLSTRIGETIKLVCGDASLQAHCWLIDPSEVFQLGSFLHKKSYFANQNYSGSGTGSSLTSHLVLSDLGWERIEEIERKHPESGQGFVAMRFSDEMYSVYAQAIAPAITQAGYSPLKIDDKENAGSIYDEIIVQIRRSRFVVADLTELNNGVYYEAGFAHGLGLTVFLTCEAEGFDKRHFDIAHINCIRWKRDNLEGFKEKLAKRIESVLGQGPLVR